MVKSGSIIALEADPDDAEDAPVTEAAVERALAERRARRAVGRPKGATSSTKRQVAIRLDLDVLAHFKGDGAPGWQTRVNEALRKAAGL